jgi:hypothetical protein
LPALSEVEWALRPKKPKKSENTVILSEAFIPSRDEGKDLAFSIRVLVGQEFTPALSVIGTVCLSISA